MRNTTIISLITLTLSLGGCGSETPQATTKPEVKPPAPVVKDSHNTNSSGTQYFEHTLTLAGVTLDIRVQGSIAPNAVLDISIVQTGGDPPTAIRVYVGDASGVGSVKTKAHSHGTSYHVTAQAPATLPENSSLWIEVQNADGSTGYSAIHIK